KALRPGQPRPSAPAPGWTPASSFTSCRPLRLRSLSRVGGPSGLYPVPQGRRGYGKFGYWRGPGSAFEVFWKLPGPPVRTPPTT
ncbi:hypothetical protein U0070_012737, partial [Myodes glareolus]